MELNDRAITRAHAVTSARPPPAKMQLWVLTATPTTQVDAGKVFGEERFC